MRVTKTSDPVMPRMVALLIPRLAELVSPPDKPGSTPEWQLAKVLAARGLNASTWYNVLIGRNTPSLSHWLEVKEVAGDLTELDKELLADLRAANAATHAATS